MADEHTDTPPVAGEITDAAIKAAADAMRTLLVPFAHECQPFATGQIGNLLNPTTSEVATAALTAALPYLTAEWDAVIEQLRAGYASCEYLMPWGHEDAQTCDQPCHPSTDRCLQHDPRHLDYIDSLKGEVTCLKDAHEGRDVNDRERDAETTARRAELQSLARTGLAVKHDLDETLTKLHNVREERNLLRARDAAWKAYAANLAQLVTSIGFDAWRGVDKGHDVLDDIYQATVVPPLPAVLADPAPSTDLSGFTITAAPPSVAAVMDLVSRGELGYLAPSQEWIDGHGDPLPDDQQDGADYLQRAGLLHEFDEWFPTKPAAPSTPEGDQAP